MFGEEKGEGTIPGVQGWREGPVSPLPRGAHARASAGPHPVQAPLLPCPLLPVPGAGALPTPTQPQEPTGTLGRTGSSYGRTGGLGGAGEGGCCPIPPWACTGPH